MAPHHILPLLAVVLSGPAYLSSAFTAGNLGTPFLKRSCRQTLSDPSTDYFTVLSSATEESAAEAISSSSEETAAEPDYETPDDAVIQIKPPAMGRLRELKAKQSDPNAPLVLRMGVRNGGCSGLSYVMDFSTEEEIQDDDAVDEYLNDGIKCVVDAKSMLYLYGLELDYSDDLIGGGFKFFNPNAEESCGCGSSFGV